MATYPGTASDAWNRLNSFYSGSAYSPTNLGGMGNGGHRLNFVPSLQDTATVAAEVAAHALIAATAASQQDSWGPTFSTAAGSVTYLSATTFATVGDLPTDIALGTHIVADCGTDGFRYGIVTGITGTTEAVVTVQWYWGSLTANLRSISNDETHSIYLINYLDIEAAKTSCRNAQEESFANASGAALSAESAHNYAIIAAASSMAVAPIRDTLGKFVGVIPPTLNLFCRDRTDDTVPIGSFARSTGVYRRGPTGFMEWVPAGSIRREWDLNGNLMGWLIERQATNLVFDSATYASWAGLGAFVVPNAAKAPDGTTTAYKMVEDTSNGYHYMVSNTATAANGTYTKQIKIKPAGRTKFTFQLSDYVSSVVIATYDLAAKTCSVVPGYAPWTDVEAKIEDAEDGYLLCTLTATKAQGTSISFLISSTMDDGSRSYTGDGVSGYYIWGPQLEAGRYASSLVPTAATAVTRPSDVWTIPVSSFKFNASAGSFYIQAMTAKALPQPGLGQMAFMIDDGTWQNLIMLYRYTDEILWLTTLSNGVNIAINCGTFANNVPIRLVMSFSASLFKVCVNGGDVLKSNFTRMSGLSTLRLGNDLALTQPWNSTIGHFVHFPQELSDAAMKSITA